MKKYRKANKSVTFALKYNTRKHGIILRRSYTGNFVCNGTQSRHRAEWNTAKVHIQSGYNDAYTIVGKLVAYINQAAVKELGFVNAHYIYL